MCHVLCKSTKEKSDIMKKQRPSIDEFVLKIKFLTMSEFVMVAFLTCVVMWICNAKSRRKTKDYKNKIDKPKLKRTKTCIIKNVQIALNFA